MEWGNQTIRDLERASIRKFMTAHKQYLAGRVLDFGCGKQPYRDLVSGEYVPVDAGDSIPDGDYDAVMCNQVLQYVLSPHETLASFADILKDGAHLVCTYPTCWDEIEPTDLWRFTRQGMEFLLHSVGLDVIVHERRAEIPLGGFKFPLGYGVVARA